MTAAIAIFVKTPGHSPIKTRLAADLGRDLAEQWHRHAAACVESIARASGLPAYWAVAEREALDDPLWAGLPRLVQPEGSLGIRMAGIHAELIERHGGALLVGADLPQIRPEHLRRAAGWLDASAPRQVLGPANDGGFWLFGSNRVHEPDRWTAPTYSRARTAEQFIDAINADIGNHESRDAGWLILETLTDLDELADLDAVLNELAAVEAPNSAQQTTLEWLRRRRGRAA